MRDKSTLTKEDSLALKGIAITMLVFYHCFVNHDSIARYDIDYFPLGQSLVFALTRCCKICVSIFAFISGYGLCKSFQKLERSPGRAAVVKWEISRIIKTLSGFWVIFVLVMIYAQVTLGLPQKIYFKEGGIRGTVYMLLEALGMAQLFGTPTMTVTWWYMGAAVVYIVLLPLLYRASRKAGYLSVAAFLIFLPRVLGIKYPGSMSPYIFLLAFLLGMCFEEYELFGKLDKLQLLKNKAADNVLRFVLDCALLLGCFLVYMRIPWDTAWEIHFALCPVVVICFCKRYLVDIPLLRSVLMFLGKYSMDVFLIHSLIKNRFYKDFVYSFKYFWLIPVVLLAMSLLFAVVTELFKKAVHYDRGIEKLTEKACTLIQETEN